MKTSGIYKIVSTISGKIIIGQTINFIHRWSQYKCLLRNNRHSNLHLQNAWNKYGEQNFKFEIILSCPIEKLDEEEIRLIQEHKSNNRRFGYNITSGGDRPNHTDKTKEKIRQSLMGRKHSAASILKMSESKKKISEETKLKYRNARIGKKMSSETREKIRNALLGRQPSKESIAKMSQAKRNRKVSKETREKLRLSRLGKKMSDETKIKLSKYHLGTKASEESKKQMSKAQNGHVVSEQTRLKISMSLSGHNHPNFGKHLSEETKKKIGDSHRGEKSVNFGKHLSEETRNKIAEAGRHRKQSDGAKILSTVSFFFIRIPHSVYATCDAMSSALPLIKSCATLDPLTCRPYDGMTV